MCSGKFFGFYGKGEIYNFTEVLETAAIYKAAVFEYNDKKGNTIDGE